MAEEKEMTVNELTAKRNELDAKIMAIEKEITDSNYEKFVEEVMNLRDHVGKGFISGDYYAINRYYSEIPGVKNIRFHDDYNEVEVKVTSPIGYLVPNSVEINGTIIKVIFSESKNFDPTVNY